VPDAAEFLAYAHHNLKKKHNSFFTRAKQSLRVNFRDTVFIFCVADMNLFVSDPDPNWLIIIDPDPIRHLKTL